jgi:hypothetical protein
VRVTRTPTGALSASNHKTPRPHPPHTSVRRAKISNADFEAIPLNRHDWHGDWNYDITTST